MEAQDFFQAMTRYSHLIPAFIFGALMLTGCIPSAHGEGEDVALKQSIARFLHIDENRLFLECPQHTLSIDDSTLQICLNKEDNQKRCEIAIHDLRPEEQIAFDFQLDPSLQPSDRWFSVMQIHSFPDSKEEHWRCPPVALLVENAAFRLPNRWDATPISHTSGHHCTEAGSTIQQREIFSNLPAMNGIWHHLHMGILFAFDEKGRLEVAMNDKRLGTFTGPNSYNDQRPPYLKLGIYKPTSWKMPQNQLCVRYKNIKLQGISTQENKQTY